MQIALLAFRPGRAAVLEGECDRVPPTRIPLAIFSGRRVFAVLDAKLNFDGDELASELLPPERLSAFEKILDARLMAVSPLKLEQIARIDDTCRR